MLTFGQLQKNDVFVLLDEQEESSLYQKCSEKMAFCFDRFTGGKPKSDEEYVFGPLRWNNGYVLPHEISRDAVVRKIKT